MHVHARTHILSYAYSSVLAKEQLYFNWGQWTGNAHKWWSYLPVFSCCRNPHICKSLAPADLIALTLKRGHSYHATHYVSVSCSLSVTLCFVFSLNLLLVSFPVTQYFFSFHALIPLPFLTVVLNTLISCYQQLSTCDNSAAMHDTLIAF